MHFHTQALAIARWQMKALIVTAVLLISGATQPLYADQTTRCTVNGSNQTACRIDQPVVTQPLTPYPQVIFQPGDQVTVNAGGCVQTGGLGATWKRYVNPSGPDSNVKYWGTISIPGATAGVVRVSDVIGKTLTIAPGISPPLVLSLGYVDSKYSDNGYDSHDDGTQNQCKNVPNAFVELTITHASGTTASCAGSSGNNPLDLVWTSCDLNGFPLNPVWRNQANANGTPSGNEGRPPLSQCPQAQVTVTNPNPNMSYTYIQFPSSCVSWPLTYDSGDLCGPHVNYFAVTYQGPVDWWQKSDSYPSFSGWDDDYNYYMFTPNHEGEVGTQPSTDSVEIEFDSDETIDHFSGSSPLWTRFRSLVDNNNSAAQALVHHNTAVVVSLVGLDCAHSCGTEEHPAYAMAVDTDNSNLADDQWGVFARNWGDEGMCASDEHNIPINDLKVLIPWLAGASAVSVLPNTQFYPFSNSGSNAAVPTPQISVVQGQGILLDFTLPDPSTQMGVAGEVHLQWTFAAGRKAFPPKGVLRPLSGQPNQQTRNLATGKPIGAIVSLPPSDDADKEEGRVSALLSKMPASQLAALEAQLPIRKKLVIGQAKLPMRPVVLLARLPEAPHTARLVVPQSVPDARLAQRNALLRSALCQAYNNNVPGFPSACRRVIAPVEKKP